MTTYIICINLFLSLFGFNSKETNPQASNKEIKSNTYYPKEKVYLHTDHENYYTGDTIWLKGYLVESSGNKPSLISNNLHVELINSKGIVINRHTLLSYQGLSYGEFSINDTLPSGIYQIRAYTNYMRNFQPDFFFTKNINISSPLIPSTENGSAYLTTTTNLSNQLDIDLQFLPEGGNMVTGVPCKVSFRAVSPDGLPCKVEGIIEDENGNTCTTFKSIHNGMGFFMLTSEKGKNYTAKIKDVKTRFKLPEALEKGVSLSITEQDSSNLVLRIKQNPIEFKEQNFTLSIQTNGQVFKEVLIPHKKFFFTLGINKNEIPKGIVCFTLFDKNGNPLAERIYFNRPKQLEIKIQADKQLYRPREKVTLSIESSLKNKPIAANLSFAVIDLLQLPTNNDNTDNIASYFLLSSELKGKIHNPSYYFTKTNKDINKHTDLLMLTHGWRKYNLINNDSLKYQPEKGFSLSGKIKRLTGNKPFIDAKVELMIYGNQIVIHTTKTDENGEYSFENLLLNDSTKVVAYSVDKNGKRKGRLELYPQQTNFAPTNLTNKPFFLLQTKNNNEQLNTKEINEIEQFYRLKNIYKHIDIDEVVVKSKSKKSEPAVMREKMFTSTVGGDKLYEVDDQLFFRDIKSMVNYYTNGMGGKEYFLDNLPISIDELSSIPVSDIEKIVRIPASSPSRILLGTIGDAIILYTKNGKVNKTIDADANLKHLIAKGFYKPKEFYTPKYDKTKDGTKPDMRKTIHWEPYINTGSDGKATISFYNSDRISRFGVHMEGITTNGNLGTGYLHFETGD